MLWFKFNLGLMFFELVSTLCAIVPDYANEYMTKENKNWTRFKNFAPNLNLNHNISMTSSQFSFYFLLCFSVSIREFVHSGRVSDWFTVVWFFFVFCFFRLLFYCKATGLDSETFFVDNNYTGQLLTCIIWNYVSLKSRQ